MTMDINDINYGCTIIIPTHNRPEYLKRILDYYSRYGRDINIIIGDSSSDEDKKRNEKIIVDISNENVLYKQYPSEINPYYKTAHTLNYVKDKYCALCADDDFITPSGIKMSMKFFEKNPDYNCAHGKYIGYCLKKDKNGEIQFYWKPAYTYESITSPDPEKRLLHQFTKFVPTFYAIHRTDFQKFLFDENKRSTNSADNLFFGEILMTMLTVIYGKMKKMDVLCSAREVNPYSTGGTIKSLRDLKSDGSYDEQYLRIKKSLAKHLKDNTKLSLEEAESIIDKGMAEHLRIYNTGSKLPRKIGLFLEGVPLPYSVDHGIRSVYRKMFPQKGFEDWRDYPPPQKDLEEFNRIKDIVINSRG